MLSKTFLAFAAMNTPEERLVEILQRLTDIIEHQQRQIDAWEATRPDCKEFSMCGVNPSVTCSAGGVCPAEGQTYRVLQLIHASVQAGYWQKADGKPASFQQVCQAVLEPMGVTIDYVRQYLSKAYDRQTWYDFAADIDREARNYKRKHDRR